MPGQGTRVAFFLPSMEGGGAERNLLAVAGGIAKRGFRVDLVLARAAGPLLESIPEGVTVIDLDARRVVTSVFGLVGYLRRHRPAALVSGLNHANMVALWAGTLSRTDTRIVISIRNTLSQVDIRFKRLMPFLIRRFYPWAHAIVAVSAGVADDLAATTGLPRERIHVVFNPVVTPQLHERARLPTEVPWDSDSAVPVVLGVGALTSQKDFPTLIRAFDIARRQVESRLVILGEGSERSRLEALVRELGLSDRVLLPGFVKNPPAVMARSDLFVLSSLYEGLPTVLIEAAAVGMAVVSTDCPSGPAEILAEGWRGRLVPVGDVNALAAAIVRGLTDPAAHRLAAESVARFDTEVVVPRYLELMGLPPDESA